MSTIEEFENAPVGATATAPNGNIAIKTSRSSFQWSVYDSRGKSRDKHLSVEMGRYTLNPVAPTSAREALDLAWDLAHPVREGQVIPEGTRYLTSSGSGVREYTTKHDVKIRAAHATVIRTLDPLPDPEPDWLDAPAVMARPEDDTWIAVWQPCDVSRCSEATRNESRWVSPRGGAECRSWRELTDVTPLYPKGQEA